jgi:phage virion morphogenesis protein
MANNVDVSIDTRELEAKLRNILNQIKYPFRYKEIVDTIQVEVFKDIADHFRREEGPEGRWQQWSDGYKKYRQSIGKGSGKILQLTGRLRNSTVLGGKSDDEIRWINKTEYAGKHQWGTAGMPQRKFLWVSDKALETMAVNVLTLIHSGELDGR